MAVSRRLTYGLLNAWAEYMFVNPWHFNQVTGANSGAAADDGSQFVYVQPERERIVQGITKALALVINKVGFYPRPTWIHETIPMSYQDFLAFHRLKTTYRYVDAIGRRGVTILEADAPIVFSDPDTTGTDTLATITATVPAGTLAAEVEIFFTAADSLRPQADEHWRIEPVEVTVVGTTATITGHRSLFVKPAIWRKPYTSGIVYGDSSKNVGDIDNPADFVTVVDVARVYPDTTDAITFRFGPNGCTPDEMVSVIGSGYIVNAEYGRVGLAYDYCEECGRGWQGQADIYYRAGLPLDYLGYPDYAVMQAIIQLANAKQPMKLTDSDIGNEVWHRDARVYNPSELISESDRNNPFGLEYGSVDAWRVLKDYQPVGMGALR
jgi:hypothetical protein